MHWLVDSPDPVHSGDPKTRAARSAQTHKTRTKGAGLGLPFAVTMVESTGVPIGLVACAHGGTSMEQWNPAKKEQGGKSLYGSMLRQVKLAGGKVKGVLWYQGESDALGGAAWKAYPQVFSDFIAAVRSDFGQPELPFYYVQIGRFVTAPIPRAGTPSRTPSARCPDRVPNTAVVSVIDLELDDGIHVGTQGLKRAGQRLARIAQRELFGQVGRPRRRSTASRGARTIRWSSNSKASTWARSPPGMAGWPAMMGGRHDWGPNGHGRHVVSPGEAPRHRAQARAAHRRLLDPQGRWNQHPAYLRGRRRQGQRHRHPEAFRAGAPRTHRSGTATGWTRTAT